MRPYLAGFIGAFVPVFCGCGSAVPVAENEQRLQKAGIKPTEF